MRKLVCSVLAVVLLSETVLLAVGSKNAEYVGGTVTSIKEETEGKVSTASETEFVFSYKGGSLSVPYARVNGLEYGQKAGRRVGVAIMVSPLALFSKKRKHFLTVNWQDDQDKQQAIVLELGKDITRVILSTLEARTGKQIEYQDEEARKSSKGN